MNTYAEVHKASEGLLVTCVDHATPAGHFLATTKVLDITTIYLLEGSEGSFSAPIKGRVELPAMNRLGSAAIAYKGGRVKGGTFAGIVTDYTETFASMV